MGSVRSPSPALFSRGGILCGLIVAAVIATGCGPSLIKGRPPFVALSRMTLDNGPLAASFDIRNRNEVSMSIDSIEILMRVDQTELLRFSEAFDLTVAANGTEEIRVEEPPREAAVELLRSLQRGEVMSLSFELEGRVHTLSDGFLSFEQIGHLYTVPGRPGQFRSAVRDAQELRRKEPY